VALAACDAGEDKAKSEQGAPALEAPAPEGDAARAFAPVGDAAARVSGELTVSVAQNFPDAGAANREAREMLTLSGANGYALQAELVGAAAPSTLIEGQTLRGAMGLPVEATNILIYRVLSEKKAGAAGICGDNTAGHVLVWEPEGASGEPVLKLMGLL